MSYFKGHVPKDIIVKISRVEYAYIHKYTYIHTYIHTYMYMYSMHGSDTL